MTAWPLAARVARLIRDGRLGATSVRLRARAGPVRDAWLALCGPLRKVPANADAVALCGGLDVAATLAAGRPVHAAGLLAAPGPLLVPMADRAGRDLAALLARAIDDGAQLVAMDEGAADDLPTVLAARLDLIVDLDGLALADLAGPEDGSAATSDPNPDPDPVGTIAAVAATLGVADARPALAALRTARAFAAPTGGAPGVGAIAAGVELTLAPRATRLPDGPEAETRPATPPEPEVGDDATAAADGPVADRVLDAVRTALPADLLAGLTGRTTAARGRGAGARRTGNRTGRPLPARPGRLGGRARLDLVATLRAAAPWQALRGRRPGQSVRLRAADIRLQRRETRSDRLVIFAVDASGSAAVARLAEAKGAVETLLAEAYARRDHVALIGFRGQGADLLLPPTRSLVRTKRELARLPGGGGTPLAAGLRAGTELGRRARARGMTPALVVLTDGRPNVGLSGSPGRAAALEDAHAMARHVRAEGLAGLVIDCGARPTPALRELGAQMGVACLPLPRSGAAALGRTVAAVL